jgi:hypothetical protein
MADTFCILPFRKLCVSPEGGARPCSAFNGRLQGAGGTLSVYRHSLDQIWNGEDMRGIRRAMHEGRRVDRCWQCVQHEDAGYQSTRTEYNRNWRGGWINEERLTPEEVMADSAARGYREEAPSFLLLMLGTLCNLKCRMCPAEASSSVNRDPVQTLWAGGPHEEMPRGAHWKESPEILAGLLGRPEQLRALRIYGGEPLVIREVGEILQRLIDRGVSQQIEVMLSTNASTAKPAWLGWTGSFRKLRLTISLDGIGPVFDYIRHPARWEQVRENIAFFRTLPRTEVVAGVTVQAYNLLQLVALFRYLDEQGIPFSGHSLISPVFLRSQVLPPGVRAVAAGRLRAYADDGCLPARRGFVLSLATGLESYGLDFDPLAFRDFMRFTNDLDASRGERFGLACAETFELIQADGLVWVHDTVHAHRAKAVVRSRLANGAPSAGNAPALPASGRPTGVAAREISLSLEPTVLRDVSWHDGTATCEGNDPQVEFDLPRRLYVHTLCLECSYLDADSPRHTLQIYWMERGRNEFAGDERNSVLHVGTEPRQKLLSFPVWDTIDRLRIDPHTGPCQVRIDRVVVLAEELG